MPKYLVSMPTTGRVTLEVEADDEEQAKERFFDVMEETSDVEIQDAHEWEYCEHIVQGNVFSGMQNEVEVEGA